MKLSNFKVLTFDCYGTLIDWEKGLFEALQPLLSKRETPPGREEALATFARHETEQEALTPEKRYSELLSDVHRLLAKEWGAQASEAEHAAFGASVGNWPAFADSPSALAYLKRHYKLVILSNVDRASFSGSNARLGVTFDHIFTAEDIGSYKPSRRNFDYMLEKLGAVGIGQGEILHTAQSLFHDHAPAKAMGFTTAWIDRRHDQEGWGATMPAAGEARPDFRFHSLADMVKAHEAEQAVV